MSDLLALLDTLDGLHKAATPEPWWRDRDSIESNTGGVISGWSFDGDADLTIELRNAYPRLAQALRAALTPATDGEREARRVANEAGDADMDNIGHLRHTLTLLDNERLSHTDEVRRLDLEIDRLRTECIRRATDRDSARAEVAALTKQLNHKVTS